MPGDSWSARKRRLLIAAADDAWMEHARCRQLTAAEKTKLFYPKLRVGPGSGAEIAYRPARVFCAGCGVLGECRRWILATEPVKDRHGFCGGMSPNERYRQRDNDAT